MTTLHDITLQCPICTTWFASTAVARPGRPAGMRTDFHQRVDGPPPLQYHIHLCPDCGFAGPRDDFGADELCADGIGARSEAATSPSDVPRTPGASVAGSEKYEAAAAAAVRRGSRPREVAELLIRAAWCCVDEHDIEAERYFRRQAARTFEAALARYDEVGREERAMITYMVGELWRRTGDRRVAASWFDRVQNEVVDVTTQRWVVDLAAQQRDDPREWLTCGNRDTGGRPTR
jgi:uncharacterized protein